MRKLSIIEKYRKKYDSCHFISSREEVTDPTVFPFPQIGKSYHFYDDGKPSESRHYFAKIERIVPMKYVRRRMKELTWAWRNEAIHSAHLYAAKSDYAIAASIKGYEDHRLVWFFRTKNGGWFSIDYPRFWMSGRIDVTCDILKTIVEYHENYNPEYVSHAIDGERQRIRANRPDASEEEVERLLRLVVPDDVVTKYPLDDGK